MKGKTAELGMGGRVYKLEEKTLISSTTAIQWGLGAPHLHEWFARIGAEIMLDSLELLQTMDRARAMRHLASIPFKIRDRAAESGTIVHAAIEAHVEGKEQLFDLPPKQQRIVRNFHRFVLDWNPEFLLVETTVYAPDYGYAGTLDAIIRAEGLGTIIVDYKTGRHLQVEAALQQASYRYAQFYLDEHGDKHSIPAVDGAALLHITEQGYELVPVAAGKREWEEFLGCLQTARWRTGVGERAIGKALIPPGQTQPDPFEGLSDVVERSKQAYHAPIPTLIEGLYEAVCSGCSSSYTSREFLAHLCPRCRREAIA
ncbi:MAG: hypothetical protein ACYDCC_04700 [Actinomycetota bacterium]